MKYIFQHTLIFIAFLMFNSTGFAKDYNLVNSAIREPLRIEKLSWLLQEAAVKDSSNIKQVPRWIMDWLNVNGVTLNDSIIVKRDEFALATFVNVYMAGILEGDEWIVKKLNELAYARDEQKNSPYLAFTVKLHNRTPGAYKITILMDASSSMPASVVTEAKLLLNETVSGKTYSRVEDSRQDVTEAIKNVLNKVQEDVGTSLAPDFAIRYDNKLYMNGHVIKVWQEDKEIVLEAVNKKGIVIDDESTWGNIEGRLGSASLSIKEAGEKEVSLTVKEETMKVKVIIQSSDLKKQAQDLLKELLISGLKNLQDSAMAYFNSVKTKIPLLNQKQKEAINAFNTQQTAGINTGDNTFEVEETFIIETDFYFEVEEEDKVRIANDSKMKDILDASVELVEINVKIDRQALILNIAKHLLIQENLDVLLKKAIKDLEDDLLLLGKDVIIGAIQG
ncbi:MAG TPA: hypothetical protein VIK89_03680, partial [Cytophagaceae bacterium]